MAIYQNTQASRLGSHKAHLEPLRLLKPSVATGLGFLVVFSFSACWDANPIVDLSTQKIIP
jgi:hypothetical protein